MISRQPRLKPRIQSLGRADAIIETIATAPGGLAKLAHISAKTGLHKNTVFTLVETLEALGLVKQHPTSRHYRLGPRLFELARKAEAGVDLIGLARPAMIRLSSATRETVSLGIPAALDLVIVSTVESSYGVRGAQFQGRHAPYHASAAGKATLAFLPETQREAILEARPPQRLTKHTITDPKRLAVELAAIRKRGWAFAFEEEEIGANAAAAPIFNRFGEVAGAIAVWGPVPRLGRAVLSDIGRQLAAECRATTAALD